MERKASHVGASQISSRSPAPMTTHVALAGPRIGAARAGIVTRPVLSGTSSKAPEKNSRWRSRAGALVKDALDRARGQLLEPGLREDVQAVLLTAGDDQPVGQVLAVLRGQEDPALVVEARGVGAEEQRHACSSPASVAPPATSARHRTPLSPTCLALRPQSAVRRMKPQVSAVGEWWRTRWRNTECPSAGIHAIERCRRPRRHTHSGGRSYGGPRTLLVSPGASLSEDGAMTTDTRPAAAGTAPLDEVRATARQIAASIESVVEGAGDTVKTSIAVLLAEGHLLIEDVPGVGKTMLAKALARSIDCTVRRIQFTPDLLPCDVTGVRVFNQESREFEFKPGRGVRQHRPRRRDQPGLAEDAVGPARGDGGAPGHRRRHDLRAGHAVHGRRDAEPRRDGRHVSPARGAARPLHGTGVDGLSRPRAELAMLDTHGGSSPLDDLQPVADAHAGRRMIARGPGRTRRSGGRQYAVALVDRDPQLRPSSGSAPRRARPCTSCEPPRAAPRSTTATTSLPDDVQRLAVPVLAHRLLTTAEAQIARTATADDRRRPRRP